LNALWAQINQATPGNKRDSLINKFEITKSAVVKQIDNFIATKPASPVSSYILYVTSPVFPGIESIEEYYSRLKPSAQGTFYGQQLSKMINATKIGLEGSQAVDFVQNDTANKPVSLSSFKGKYVLVDFWASWCGPCRAENPNVLEAYNKFKDKNFTIVGVSLDQDKEAWKQAIAKDKLPWTHISDLKQWESSVVPAYGIEGIPFNVLLDPTGKIIASGLRGEGLESKLAEVLK
jgi:thiol-disulfide isomerase/thioredoxin